MKPWLLCLGALLLASCSEGKPPAGVAAAFVPVIFEHVTGVEAERIKLRLDASSGGYITQLTRDAGQTLGVLEAKAQLTPSGLPAQLLVLTTPACQPDCWLVIASAAEKPDILNIFSFNPSVQKVYLANVMSAFGWRDILIAGKDEAQRFRYEENLVDVDGPVTGTYFPIGTEPLPQIAEELQQ